mgnify:CR=1 FL=1
MVLTIAPDAPKDFDFVIGDWTVKHRRLKERLQGCNEWLEFDGELSSADNGVSWETNWTMQFSPAG